MLQLLFSVLVLILIFNISPMIGATLLLLLVLCLLLAKLKKKEETNSDEHGIEGEDNYTYYDDYYDFPEPDFSDPEMIPDPQMCLDFVAKYEDLAERARACGYDDLADRYEAAADHWRYLYEEAEDEEMEW